MKRIISTKFIYYIMFSLVTFLLSINFAGCSEENIDSTATSNGKNVMIILLDGASQRHISHLGYTRNTTPNIDNLASQGLTLTSVIPSGCSTKASVTSLLTAMDYRYHHLLDHNAQLSSEYVTIAENFFNSGYITAAWGSSPIIAKEFNYDQGFNIFVDHTAFIKEGEPWKYVRGERLVNRVVTFLDNYDKKGIDKPFFGYLHIEEPHPPWFSPSPWIESEEDYETLPFNYGCTYVPPTEDWENLPEETKLEYQAKYDGALFQADQQVGRIIDKLKETGQLENTVIFIVTDHGYDVAERYATTHGYSPYDEVTKTAAVIFDGGRKIDYPDPDKQVRLIDMGPTALKLAGIQPHENFQGLDIFSNYEEIPEYAYVSGYGSTIVRSNKFKLMKIYMKGESKYYFRENGPFKEGGYYLFDLENDPGETENVLEKFPKIQHEMKKLMKQYLEDINGEFILGTTKRISSESVEGLKDLGYIQ
jgi:arylsulfatase A-like enzyme